MIVGVVVTEMLIASAGIGYPVTFSRTVLDGRVSSPGFCWCC